MPLFHVPLYDRLTCYLFIYFCLVNTFENGRGGCGNAGAADGLPFWPYFLI